MGHCITAIVGPEVVAREILSLCPSLVSIKLVDGLRLIPLSDDDLDALGFDYSTTAKGFIYLSPQLQHYLCDLSANGPLVYLETEYFGGMGGQAAIAYERRVLLTIEHTNAEDSINRALRLIGVKKAISARDEFEYVGLSRYRYTDDWKEAAKTG